MRFTPIVLAMCAALASVPASAQEETSKLHGEVAVGSAMPGSFYAKPSGDGPFPTIILIGGSSGGDGTIRRIAPRFLDEGYAVFGLVYYSPSWFGRPAQFPSLPAAFDAIPVERVDEARRYICRQPTSDCERTGVYGVSKGGEYALLAGAYLDDFAAIAAIVPSDVVWEGWGPGTRPGENSSFSLAGKPLPFVPYERMQEAFAALANGERARLRLPHDRGRRSSPERTVAARIPVERIAAPVLVAGGDADDTWNSGAMAQAIVERRVEAGLPTEGYVFTDAGHGLSGDGSNAEGWYDEAELEAQRTIWPATLRFFARHLKGKVAQPIRSTP